MSTHFVLLEIKTKSGLGLDYILQKNRVEEYFPPAHFYINKWSTDILLGVCSFLQYPDTQHIYIYLHLNTELLPEAPLTTYN